MAFELNQVELAGNVPSADAKTRSCVALSRRLRRFGKGALLKREARPQKFIGNEKINVNCCKPPLFLLDYSIILNLHANQLQAQLFATLRPVGLRLADGNALQRGCRGSGSTRDQRAGPLGPGRVPSAAIKLHVHGMTQ